MIAEHPRPEQILRDALREAMPRGGYKRRRGAWSPALVGGLAISLAANVFFALFFFGPADALWICSLDVMVKELAEGRRVSPETIWRELERDYRFESPVTMSRLQARRVGAMLVTALENERWGPH